jgi:hypothetical protein
MNTAKKWLRDAKSAGKFDKWTPFGLWSLKYMYFLHVTSSISLMAGKKM